MCGIAGEVRLDGAPDAGAVRRMARALAHRGPDAESFFTAGPAALGHRRLSILDLQGGAQPMVRDGVALVFNGQEYDHEPLRARLRARGHRFQTRSDTEVVLGAYLEFGERFAEELRGMFAVAVWDSRAQKLVLARDRLGKKPLYYALANGGAWLRTATHEPESLGPLAATRLVFGSEPKALLARGDLPEELDPAALGQYLASEAVPAPRSMWRAVRKLPAAHVAVLDSAGFRSFRYWELPTATGSAGLPWSTQPDAALPSGAMHEAAQQVRALLDRAVAKRLVADVPVGLFLSGGIDSTAIAALATRHSARVQTFSIGFAERSFDESAWAQLASDRLGTEHHQETLTASACVDLLPEAARQLDEPFADPSYLPTALLSRFARRSVTVALAGDGGDELFGGYDPFLAHRPAALAARLPGWAVRALRGAAGRLPASSNNMSLDFRIKQFLRGVTAEPGLRHASWIAALLPDEIAQLLSPDLRAAAAPQSVFAPALADLAAGRARGVAAGSLEEALRYYQTRYLADDILVKADRASMAASLEVRAPFLDVDLVEAAARLPAQLKVSLTQTKLLLKRALAGLVPDEILGRPKKGFGIPIAAWLRGPLRPLVAEALSERALREGGLFHPPAVQALVDRHQRGEADLRKPLWTLLMFQLWQREWGQASAAARKVA